MTSIIGLRGLVHLPGQAGILEDRAKIVMVITNRSDIETGPFGRDIHAKV